MRSKRLISLLVAVCMMITMLPLSAVTAFAADTSTVHEAKDGEGIYRYAYKENEDGETVTITEFLGPVDPANNGPYDIEIPTELDHHPVTGLGEYSFSGTYSPDHQTNHNLISFCNQIQSVTIPESVTSIGKSAFEHCSKLDSLTIKGVATSIGAYAFASCTSLTSLSLVGNFQTIGEQAFAYCGMTSLTTDADITSIGEYAFSHCTSLTSLSLTGSVQTIGYQAFACCTSLTSLSLTGDIQKIGDYAFGYCSSLYTATLSKNLTSIGTYAFEYCTSLNSIEIPGKVTEIGDYAFIDAGLTSVTIDEGVKSTGAYMFYKCGNLTTVTLPESLTTIADGSFAFCSNLDHVKIPARVTCIGDGAFSNCTSLSDITLQDGVKTIGADAFFYCRELTSITLPGSVTDIGKEAFYYCDELASITIPENVKTINPDTFYWCSSLKDITLPAGLTSFQDELTRCPAGRFYATDYKKDENDKPILNPDGSYIYIYTPDGAIYFNNDRDHADNLLKNPVLAGRNFLCLCHVTFDAKGGKTDYDKVPVYETEKITDTKANELKATDLDAINHPTRTGYKFTGWYTDNDQLFDVKETAITEDTTLYAGWEFDPDALDCHQLTVTGGTVTVKYDGSDVTSKLNSRTDATTGKKTYYVPDGATVTVTLDKTAVPNGKVFDGWSTSLPTGQDYKAESITFRMSSGVDIAAQYRDAAADHTHDTDTAVCHPLTVTGGIVTVKKGDKDVTDTLTVTTDEATGKKTYSVPEGATVTVTLDKTLIPEGMVFDIWSTGKFSLPLGQDYKAESITFTMNTMSSDVVDIAAQYRDATIEDDGPNVLGTAAIIGTAAVGTAVLGYQAYSLGAEFAGKLMALPYFPSNRSALAMMLWEDAGKPMPESELLYPDVGQEEQDMDLQHAARWAMENELIPDLNDEGTAPEEMKFFPANPVSKLDVLNAWQKAQELKNN
uniref:leucine-rich repeat protein n=1 Tax=Faecalibacterium sp. TaxID=1971605 RepID=UPI004025F94D